MDRQGIFLYFYDMDSESLSLKVDIVRHTVCAPDWSWLVEAGQMRDFDLWSVLAGKGRVVGQGFAFPVCAGSAVLLRPGDVFLASHDPAHPLVVTSAHFDFSDIHGKVAIPEESSLPPRFQQAPKLPFYAGIMERLRQSWQDKPDRKAAAFWLAAALRELSGQKTAAAAASMPHSAELARIRAEIRNQPEHVRPISALARRLFVTPDHFCRLFKQACGLSPKEYILQAKLEAAQTLLRASSHSITRIAELLGYRDVYFFSRQFKARTGIPPLQYRKQE